MSTKVVYIYPDSVNRLVSAEKMGLVLLTGLVLGSSVVMTRFGISEIPPFPFTALRFTVAALFFLATLLVLQRKMPGGLRTHLDIAVVGITNTAIPVVAFTLALQFISSAVLTIFISLIPLFTALMAHVFLEQEKLNLIKVVGLVVALSGVMLLLTTGTTGLVEGVAGLDLRGHILALGGAVLAAAAGVYTRLRLRGVDVLVVTALQTGIAWLAVVPLTVVISPLAVGEVTGRGWLAVVYTAIIGSSFGFLLLFYLIKRFGATAAALPSYVMPAAAGLFGWLLLGEIITLPLIAGAGLILAGVFLSLR